MKLTEFEVDFMVEECLPAKRARKLPFDESPGDDTGSSGPYETFKVEVFNVIMDQVLGSIRSRFSDHKELYQDFS